MTEERDWNQSSENGEAVEEGDEKILRLLDSTDSYLTLLDSLSSTLRQGWLDLASARHSMGSSRITSSLFDLKLHPAATTVQITQLNDTVVKQQQFFLSKWTSPVDENFCSRVIEADEGELQKKSNIPQLRHRGASQFSENKERYPASSGSLRAIDDQVQKERSKSLSVFGTLVSPKLRAAQLSFETALETLVEIANMRSLILSTCAQVQQGMDDTME